jgi:hypothetical protein
LRVTASSGLSTTGSVTVSPSTGTEVIND